MYISPWNIEDKKFFKKIKQVRDYLNDVICHCIMTYKNN